jgi:hypothetical protein
MAKDIRELFVRSICKVQIIILIQTVKTKKYELILDRKIEKDGDNILNWYVLPIRLIYCSENEYA